MKYFIIINYEDIDHDELYSKEIKINSLTTASAP